jgi:hypothetical protein
MHTRCEVGQMNAEEAAIYLVMAIAGGIAGFIRFANSTRVWKFRVVLSSCFMGIALSLMAISISFGSDVNAHFWKCFGISIFIGLFQPNLAPAYEVMIRGMLGGGGGILDGALKWIGKRTEEGPHKNV